MQNTEFLIYKKIIIPDHARHFIFSDVHGKKKEVDQLIKEVGGKPGDYYTFIGDVIDRGEHNSAMLFHVLNTKNTNMVIGNHEMMLIESCENEEEEINWVSDDNGGEETFNQLFYVGMKYFKKELLEKCPLILEVEHRGKSFGFIHAGIPYFSGRNYISDWNDIIKMAQKNKQYQLELLWDRSLFEQVRFIKYNVKREKFRPFKRNGKLTEIPHIKGIDWVLHGHTGVSEPMYHNNIVWFDTGFVKEKVCVLEYDEKRNIFTETYLEDDMLDHINKDTDLNIKC